MDLGNKLMPVGYGKQRRVAERDGSWGYECSKYERYDTKEKPPEQQQDQGQIGGENGKQGDY